jgi:hypothetical protein
VRGPVQYLGAYMMRPTTVKRAQAINLAFLLGEGAGSPLRGADVSVPIACNTPRVGRPDELLRHLSKARITGKLCHERGALAHHTGVHPVRGTCRVCSIERGHASVELLGVALNLIVCQI